MVQEKLQPKAVFRAIQQHHSIGNKGYSEAEQSLYNRALGLVVPQLIEIANRLPSFKVANAQATLMQLASLAETADSILAHVQSIAEIAEHVRRTSPYPDHPTHGGSNGPNSIKNIKR